MTINEAIAVIHDELNLERYKWAHAFRGAILAEAEAIIGPRVVEYERDVYVAAGMIVGLVKASPCGTWLAASKSYWEDNYPRPSPPEPDGKSSAPRALRTSTCATPPPSRKMNSALSSAE